MKAIIITDEVDEHLEFKGDSERSVLIQRTNGVSPNFREQRVIILNPREEQAVKDAITATQRERAGQKGGTSTLMKYGNGHFCEIGAKGGRPKAKTLERRQ